MLRHNTDHYMLIDNTSKRPSHLCVHDYNVCTHVRAIVLTRAVVWRSARAQSKHTHTIHPIPHDTPSAAARSCAICVRLSCTRERALKQTHTQQPNDIAGEQIILMRHCCTAAAAVERCISIQARTTSVCTHSNVAYHVCVQCTQLCVAAQTQTDKWIRRVVYMRRDRVVCSAERQPML